MYTSTLEHQIHLEHSAIKWQTSNTQHLNNSFILILLNFTINQNEHGYVLHQNKKLPILNYI